MNGQRVRVQAWLASLNYARVLIAPREYRTTRRSGRGASVVCQELLVDSRDIEEASLVAFVVVISDRISLFSLLKARDRVTRRERRRERERELLCFAPCAIQVCVYTDREEKRRGVQDER